MTFYRALTGGQDHKFSSVALRLDATYLSSFAWLLSGL